MEHGVGVVENWHKERDKHKHHLIHLALERNFMEVTKVMVSELGFDPNVHRRSDRCTPLHLAIWFKYPEMAKLFFSLGADRKLENSYGESCGEKYEKFIESRDRLIDADTIEALLCNYRMLENHLDYGHLSACWTSLGQLARQVLAEQCWLWTQAEALEVLVQHTVRAAMAG